MIDPDVIYSVKEAAKFLSVNQVTLKRWEKWGHFKPSFRVGPRKDRKYRGKDIIDYMWGKHED